MTIRVLHVITTLGRGGAERQLVNLVCNTNRAEFEHVVCHLHAPDTFAAELRAAGHTVVNLGLPQRWPWLFAPARLVPVLRRHRPDLIQTWLFEADMAARLSTPTRTTPIINTLHLTTYEPDTIAAGDWPPWKMTALRLIDRASARWARPLFVAVSETVRQSAMRHLNVPAADIRVIYNSIDQDTLRCAPDEPGRLRAAAGIPADAFVYVNVGRLAPQKGQAYLVRAFGQVAAALPDAYLAFVGEGPLRPELESLAAEAGAAERVKFLGRRSDVGACLELADAFVFPSLFEGLPLAPIEAMLKGLPCIATSIGPVREIITDRETGVLVPPASADALAAAMLELHREPARRRQLAARAQAVARERFDSRRGLQAWEELYRELARRVRAPDRD